MANDKKIKKSGPIRLSYALPAIIILALAIVFNLFFLNTVLRRSLIAAGEFAVGAKVEIRSVRFSVKQLSLTIRDIAVADKDAPMQNMVEIGTLHGALKPLPLLSKKIVIPRLELSGLKWGTARKTSGALPPKRSKTLSQRLGGQDSKTAKLLNNIKEKAEKKATSIPAWQEVEKAKSQISTFSLDGVVKPEELESVKQAQALKQVYQDKAANYDKQIKELNIQAKLDAVKPAFEDLKNIQIQSAQDVTTAKAKIDAAQQSLRSLEEAKKQIETLRQQALNDFKESGSLQTKFNEWQKQDMDALTAKLKLPSLSFGSLTEALVGPVWLAKIRKFIELSHLARKYMPPRKPKAKKIEQPRLHGVDVYFPHPAEPPAFLIEKIVLSGTTGGEGKPGSPVDFSGTAENLTSDPRLLGRPATIDLTGSQSGRNYQVSAVLDHTGDIAKDIFRLNASGLSVSEMKLPESDYLPRFDQGILAFESSFTMEGDKLSAMINATLGNLKAPEKKGGNADLLAELWQGIDKVRIQAGVSGIGEDLDVQVSSDLDKLLSQRLQAMAGEKIGELRDKLKAEIEKYSKQKQKELMDQAGLSQNSTVNNLMNSEKSVQEKIDDIKKLIKEKEDTGKQAVDAKKKAAEEDLKKKANDQLQNLFKR